MIGRRLRQLRLARGLSLEALAAAIGGVVTKQSLSKYEQGKATPSPVVLNRLAEAMEVKAAYLWSEPNIRVEFLAYRKGSALLKGEQARVEGLVAEGLETRVHLQQLLGQDAEIRLPVQVFAIEKLEDTEAAAIALRDQWQLGLDPIANVTDVLERHSVHVLEIDAAEKFDGISAVAYDESGQKCSAAVVTRRDVPGERQRLSLARELGHLVLEIPESVDQETAAFRFGAAFLAPATLVRQEVGRKRAFIQAQELMLLKRQYGMSIQALLRRLRDLEIITESYYRQWCVDINRLQWRKHEPLELPPEQPQWMRRSVLHALAEGLISQEDAAAMTGETMRGELALPTIERRSFMKLPLEERCRILAEQAEKLTTYYAQDSEWREMEAGDLVEY
jgi:transcriptional regulator with XRE-family HTH domain